ncbi:hypothetical protein HJFPF1_09473 [Paramyrothecium foliicola]|nr:hypothetical protein HJFPF1_09473 [Paramyrothecium foliicola]
MTSMETRTILGDMHTFDWESFDQMPWEVSHQETDASASVSSIGDAVTKDSLSTTHSAYLSVDFSSGSLFGLLDLILTDIAGVARPNIMELLAPESSNSSTNTLAQSIQCTKSPWWHSEDRETLSRYCDALFEGACEAQYFLTRSWIDVIVNTARESDDPLLTAFANAVMILAHSEYVKATKSSEGIAEARLLALHTLKSASAVSILPSSLIKLQTLLLMAILASQVLELAVSTLIIQTLFEAEEDALAEQSLHFLYVLEASYAIDRGMLPILDHNFIRRKESAEASDAALTTQFSTDDGIRMLRYAAN